MPRKNAPENRFELVVRLADLDRQGEEPVIDAARDEPSSQWKVRFALMLGLERVLSHVRRLESSSEAAVQMYLDSWERDRAAKGLPPLTVE